MEVVATIADQEADQGRVHDHGRDLVRYQGQDLDHSQNPLLDQCPDHPQGHGLDLSQDHSRGQDPGLQVQLKDQSNVKDSEKEEEVRDTEKERRDLQGKQNDMQKGLMTDLRKGKGNVKKQNIEKNNNEKEQELDKGKSIIVRERSSITIKYVEPIQGKKNLKK